MTAQSWEGNCSTSITTLVYGHRVKSVTAVILRLVVRQARNFRHVPAWNRIRNMKIEPAQCANRLNGRTTRIAITTTAMFAWPQAFDIDGPFQTCHALRGRFFCKDKLTAVVRLNNWLKLFKCNRIQPTRTELTLFSPEISAVRNSVLWL
jgi:hypothetical protein